MRHPLLPKRKIRRISLPLITLVKGPPWSQDITVNHRQSITARGHTQSLSKIPTRSHCHQRNPTTSREFEDSGETTREYAWLFGCNPFITASKSVNNPDEERLLVPDDGAANSYCKRHVPAREEFVTAFRCFFVVNKTFRGLHVGRSSNLTFTKSQRSTALLKLVRRSRLQGKFPTSQDTSPSTKDRHLICDCIDFW